MRGDLLWRVAFPTMAASTRDARFGDAEAVVDGESTGDASPSSSPTSAA